MFSNHWAETFNAGSTVRINICCFSGGDSNNWTILSDFAGYSASTVPEIRRGLLKPSLFSLHPLTFHCFPVCLSTEKSENERET